MPSQRRARRLPRVTRHCMNSNCRTSLHGPLTQTADGFLLSFYGRKADPLKRRVICSPCRRSALKRQECLVNRIKAGRPVLSLEDPRLPPVPTSSTLVLLDDSRDQIIRDDERTQLSEDSELEMDLEATNRTEDDDKTPTSLEEVIALTLQSYDFKGQVASVIDVLQKRFESNKDEIWENHCSLNDIEKSIGCIRDEFYRHFKPPIKSLPPIEDLDNVPSSPKESNVKAVPPPGELIRPHLRTGDHIYAMTVSNLSVWEKGVVVSVKKYFDKWNYGIRLLSHDSNNNHKWFSREQLAYYSPPKVRVPVGTRIIAIYLDGALSGKFYSGIIAEPPKIMNKFRYLIFFDDGYTSYVHHDNIRLVVLQSNYVWDDVHSNSREFIKHYLLSYPERAMVKLHEHRVVWTEWEGEWWAAKVLQVDSSLVKLDFVDLGRVEWLFRGSTRLSPLFKEVKKQKMKKEGLISGRRQSHATRNNYPYVEYTRQTEEITSNEKRAVARKSTASRGKAQAVVSGKEENVDQMQSVQLPSSKVTPREFIYHDCGPQCIFEENKYHEEMFIKKYSVLILPILLGWERQIMSIQMHHKKTVYYLGPCGRRLRNIDEIFAYLSMTKCSLEIDFFTFDECVCVHNEFKISKTYCIIEDVSHGKENVPVPCVNTLDSNYPDYIEYSTKRLPQSGVDLNLDDEFLLGCDCEDDCSSHLGCCCLRLTIEGTKSDVGYVHRRLPEVVPTGIFECNSRCKCSKRCGNRVAQHPLRVKLQVFKTEKRGWGIRTLHDIPKGSFVCVYVGLLFDNEEANRHGVVYGDEYFAELDLIEAVESKKDGYESEYGDEDLASHASDSDTSDCVSSHELDVTLRLDNVVRDVPKADRETRSLKKKHQASENDVPQRWVLGDDAQDSEERVVKGFNASIIEEPVKPKYTSTRKYFGKEEDVYIMDANRIGNIGRYLNHSCNPNIFVQNCFVDTHDLRYPWIAFFASKAIRAGTELCWDYCYIVGQVEGKEIFCECGADNCRGRLL